MAVLLGGDVRQGEAVRVMDDVDVVVAEAYPPGQPVILAKSVEMPLFFVQQGQFGARSAFARGQQTHFGRQVGRGADLGQVVERFRDDLGVSSLSRPIECAIRISFRQGRVDAVIVHVFSLRFLLGAHSIPKHENRGRSQACGDPYQAPNTLKTRPRNDPFWAIPVTLIG